MLSHRATSTRDGALAPNTPADVTSTPALRWFAAVFALFSLAILFLSRARPIETWDESRNINNALEMSISGHWLVPMFAWAPDHWNTKPPLLICLQAALLRLGLPPFSALRLPAELAALATVLLIFWFCFRVLHRPFAGVIAGMLLMSSVMFFGLHVGISGDYDALLSLLLTTSALAFWTYVQDGNMRGLLLAGLTLSLAILTKGVAALLFLPGLLVFVFVSGKAKRTLADWRLWAVLLGAFALAGCYYVARDRLFDPGYLQSVFDNELSGRYSKTNEGHHRTWALYLLELIAKNEPGTLLLPFGFLLLRRASTADSMDALRVRSFALQCVVVPAVFLLILSTSATKISYYCAPALPQLAILSGLGADWALRAYAARNLHQSSQRTTRVPRLRTALLAFLTLTMIMPLLLIIRRNHLPAEQSAYGPALLTLQHAGLHGPIQIIDNGVDNSANFQFYSPTALFFATEAQRHGLPTGLQGPSGSVPPNTWLLTCDAVALLWLQQTHLLHNPQPIADGCTYGRS